MTHRPMPVTATRIANPTAPHLNLFARAIANSTKKLPGALAKPSERCRGDDVTPGDTDDGERPVDRGQDLIVLVERRVRDIDHVPSLQAELLCDKNRHRLKQVEPKNPPTSRRVDLQVAHSEHINARFVG